MYTHFRYESIMLRCWHADPDQRPTFSQLQAEISTTLTIAAGYMDFSVNTTCTSLEPDIWTCTPVKELETDTDGDHP